MSSLLQNLSSESILLLYLAGELPAEDRGEVEQMLAGDERLRTELEQLRSAYDGAEAALRARDASERVALPAGTAARRVGQAVRDWHAWRLSQPPAEPQRTRRRFPTWSYVAAAAVVLVVGYTGWWGIQPERSGGDRRAATLPSTLDDNDNSLAANDGDIGPATGGNTRVEVAPEEASAMGGPWGPSSPLRDAADDELDAAEDELYALSESSGSALVDDGSLIFQAGETTDER